MVKNLFIIIFIVRVCSTAVIAQQHKFNYAGYKQIPKELIWRDNLVKYIIPDSNYTYWEFVDGGRNLYYGDILFHKGEKPDGVIFKGQNKGFFVGCLPVYCTHFIACVLHGKIGYITSENELLNFMGNIDNLEEAVLLAQLSADVGVDSQLKGAAYKKTEDGYDLVLMHYTMCPQTFEAVHFIIDHHHIQKKESLGIYRTEEGCPVI